ncbi:family 16 glycosylhydrolase [Sphingomonas sp.]|uniref:family 16 glycosylhydrolase n=1 Tax=Sphingomonas sp. TaxID=28214 RepID=UPI003CC5E91A
MTGAAIVTAAATAAAAPATPAAAASGDADAAALRRAVAPLPPLNLTDMRLWNYAGRWHASEWDNGMGPIPWRYNHIAQPSGGDTFFTLDANGAPQLQAMGGTPVYTRGLWETEVTLPQLRPGLIVAPLWLWDDASRDEVDFEFAGRNGLDVTLHAALNGQMQQSTVRLFAGRDMSGERHRFGIKIDDGAGTVDMFLDGALVQRWTRSAMSFFVSHPLKPMIEMWPADPNNGGFVSWAGRWTGIAAGDSLRMTVHGYAYSAAN